MSERRTNCLSLSMEEEVFFAPGEELGEIVSVSLEPSVNVERFEAFVVLRGTLNLMGEYVPSDDDLQASADGDFAVIRSYADVKSSGNNTKFFSYKIPVDITIPAKKVRGDSELSMGVDSINCEIKSKDKLHLIASLYVNGIDGDDVFNQEAIEEEASRNSFAKDTRGLDAENDRDNENNGEDMSISFADPPKDEIMYQDAESVGGYNDYVDVSKDSLSNTEEKNVDDTRGNYFYDERRDGDDSESLLNIYLENKGGTAPINYGEKEAEDAVNLSDTYLEKAENEMDVNLREEGTVNFSDIYNEVSVNPRGEGAVNFSDIYLEKSENEVHVNLGEQDTVSFADTYLEKSENEVHVNLREQDTVSFADTYLGKSENEVTINPREQDTVNFADIYLEKSENEVTVNPREQDTVNFSDIYLGKQENEVTVNPREQDTVNFSDIYLEKQENEVTVKDTANITDTYLEKSENGVTVNLREQDTVNFSDIYLEKSENEVTVNPGGQDTVNITDTYLEKSENGVTVNLREQDTVNFSDIYLEKSENEVTVNPGGQDTVNITDTYLEKSETKIPVIAKKKKEKKQNNFSSSYLQDVSGIPDVMSDVKNKISTSFNANKLKEKKNDVISLVGDISAGGKAREDEEVLPVSSTGENKLEKPDDVTRLNKEENKIDDSTGSTLSNLNGIEEQAKEEIKQYNTESGEGETKSLHDREDDTEIEGVVLNDGKEVKVNLEPVEREVEALKNWKDDEIDFSSDTYKEAQEVFKLEVQSNENPYPSYVKKEYVSKVQEGPEVEPDQENVRKEKTIWSTILKSDEDKKESLKCYIFQKGDSLQQIANNYDVNITKLLRRNNLQGEEIVEVGQLIYIPN